MQSCQKKDTIFTQRDSTDGLFFFQKGKVRLSVVSKFWNTCLSGLSLRALGGLRLFPKFGPLLAHNRAAHFKESVGPQMDRNQ